MRFNQCTIVGRLGKDPAVKEVGGQALTTFSVGVSSFKKGGETTWFNCSWWGPRGEKVAQYMSKGSSILVVGEVGLRTWEKDGKGGASLELRVNDVQLLEKRQVDENPFA